MKKILVCASILLLAMCLWGNPLPDYDMVVSDDDSSSGGCALLTI